MNKRFWIIGGIVAAIIVIFLARIPLYMLFLNTITTTTFEIQGEELWMNGEINARTYDQFVQILDENPQITTLVEENVPGSVDDEANIRLAYLVREKGLNTKLVSQSAIYSGGVDLFLAGVKRTMARGATIGVHSWSDGINTAVDIPRDSPEHEKYLKYTQEMLGSDEFYWFTINSAPADGMYEMTEAEIVQYGLVTQPIEEE